MSIKRITISRIHSQYTAEYIANVLWRQNIAQVNSITLFSNSTNFQTAYVDIATWCDSEVAYNFIQRLKNGTKDVRIVHHNDLWWPAQIVSFSGSISLGPYTTLFTESYFKISEQLEIKPEEKPEEKVIRGVQSDGEITLDEVYTVDEAINRCILLNRIIMNASIWSDGCQYADNIMEFCFLEQELREYGSDNVDDVKIVEKLTKYFGLKDSGDLNITDLNIRLEFLRRMKVDKFPIRDKAAFRASIDILSEIDLLDETLLTIAENNSQNVTLRPHQQSYQQSFVV